MKRHTKNLFLFMAITAIFLLAFTSCEDDGISGPDVKITSITPAEVFPTETVTVEGTNFDRVQFVFLGNQQVSFQLDGNSTITFQVPEGTLAGNTLITLAMLKNYRTKAGIHINPTQNPLFLDVSPEAALPGEEVTITGGSLNNAETVTVGDTEATIVSSSDNELVFLVPEGVTGSRGFINVVTESGSGTSPREFFVGTRTAVADFNSGGLGTAEWSTYGAAGSHVPEASGVMAGGNDPGPSEGDGFWKIVWAGQGGWGAGGEMNVDLGLTADLERILLVAEMNSQGQTASHRYHIVDSSGEWGLDFGEQVYDGWQTVVVPLTDFGGFATPMDPTTIVTIKVQGPNQGDGSNELSVDNIRIIELNN